MDATRLDAALAGLEAAVERAGANLVELEQEPTVALLDAAELTGLTAARWAEARATLRTLFEAYRALGHVVERARAVRGQRRRIEPDRLAELAALLTGRSVVIAETAAPPAERDLLAGSRVLDRRPPDAALAMMAADFSAVTDVVAAAGRAWNTEVPRVAAMRGRVAELEAATLGLGQPPAATVAATGGRIDAIAARLLTDPLAHDRGELDALETELARAAAELDAVRAVRDDWVGLLASCRGLLADVAQARAAAADAAGVAAAKIRDVAVAWPAATADAADLAAELSDLGDAAGGADWRAAARGLAAWRARAGAELAAADTAVTALRNLVRNRDELRGRLAAYEAKADHLGLLEDERLAGLYAAARTELMTAPTDLARAGDLVAAYQAALSERADRRTEAS